MTTQELTDDVGEGLGPLADRKVAALLLEAFVILCGYLDLRNC